MHWIAAGYGYEITGLDVLAAYSGAMEAAKNAAAVDQTPSRVRELLAAGKPPARDFMAQTLGRAFETP